MKIRNTFSIFLVSGFWHGANWTFIIWGALNAIYFLPLLLSNRNRKNLDVVADGKLLPSLAEMISILSTFMLTVFAWIFFRSENLSHAFSYIEGIFSLSIFSLPEFKTTNQYIVALMTLLLVCFFLTVEWLGRKDKFAIENLFTGKRIKRYLFYFTLILFMYFFYPNTEPDFIYFQF